MNIRRGEPPDLEQIYTIEKRAFPATPWTRDMLHQELFQQNDRRTWVMDLEGEIIGYCMLRFGPEEIHLINMAVDPTHQKQGIGSKLLEHILNKIPPKTSVFLEVERGNFPAINLYIKSGFEEIGIRENYYHTGGDAIVMRLKV